MASQQSLDRVPGLTYAVSDTGPLISAFQSDSFGLLTQVFPIIYIPPICIDELNKHGWADEVNTASQRLTRIDLTLEEESQAWDIAKQIAEHPKAIDRVIANHLGEAQAIAVALRLEHRDDALLLDELAGRAIARQADVKLSGFPGALLLATRANLISPEELRERLQTCLLKGTHYSAALIQQGYDMAREDRR